jgi:hypothetical protein
MLRDVLYAGKIISRASHPMEIRFASLTRIASNAGCMICG